MTIDPKFGEEVPLPLVVEDNRPPAYWEDGELIVRCSAAGGCLWELIACAQGYTPSAFPKMLRKAFQEGKEAEPKVVGYLRELGWRVEGQQKEGHLRAAPNLKIRYHPDGIGGPYEPDMVDHVIEIKAFGKALWRQFLLGGVRNTIPEYQWQMSIMMIAEGKPGVWVIYNKETGEIQYEWVEEPPIPRHAIVQKMSNLVDSLNDDLSERPCDTPDHFPCRFFALRPSNDDVADTLDPSMIGAEEEFDELARELLMIKGQRDELEKRYRAVREKIIEFSGSFSKVKSNRFRASIASTTRHYPKTDAMKEDDVFDKYMRSSESKQVTVRGIE